ncbi:MAG TPA: MarR family transcriptional regulator [Bryobacteraceae bacterium]|nr:MarR family transcriptional regulator [Bryobacteraceae bacterium]
MKSLAPKLMTVLSKCLKALSTHAERHITELGLGVTDFAVLEALLHKGPLSISCIGEKVLLTSGSMTAAVDRLEAKNLVTRNSHATDRRTKLIELTPCGRALITRAFALHTEALQKAVEGVPVQDQKQLIALATSVGKIASDNLPN